MKLHTLLLSHHKSRTADFFTHIAESQAACHVVVSTTSIAAATTAAVCSYAMPLYVLDQHTTVLNLPCDR
jgi:hypothetical protein